MSQFNCAAITFLMFISNVIMQSPGMCVIYWLYFTTILVILTTWISGAFMEHFVAVTASILISVIRSILCTKFTYFLYSLQITYVYSLQLVESLLNIWSSKLAWNGNCSKLMESWMLWKWGMLLKMFLTKENHIRTSHFCVSLKYETQNSICKCRAEPKKGENSTTWLGRISIYGVVPARTGYSSISCNFKKPCCVQECFKTTEYKNQNMFWW